MHPLVVHCKKSPEFDVYIGRPTKWGNPFAIGEHGTRAEVISKYEVWLRKEIAENRITLDDLRTLKGKQLACWCAPLACHGEVIVKLIDELLHD